MFRRNVRLYVYPARDPATGELVTAENVVLPEAAHPLHALLRQRHSLVPIRGYDPELLGIFADNVLARLQAGESGWEAAVPDGVAEAIKRQGLFGWTERR
jgi:hypothetical protein